MLPRKAILFSILAAIIVTVCSLLLDRNGWYSLAAAAMGGIAFFLHYEYKLDWIQKPDDDIYTVAGRSRFLALLAIVTPITIAEGSRVYIATYGLLCLAVGALLMKRKGSIIAGNKESQADG